MFIGRGAQGIIAVDTLFEHSVSIPVVAVAGHRRIKGITNIALDHQRAADLTLSHLHSLGHRKIAFMRGQSFSSDSDARWKGLLSVAQKVECGFEWPRFASDVLTAMQTIRATLGESGYQQEWRHPFPKEACLKLEKAIQSV
jgi:DNA-binding LacI/PurR family transcriptional regulator